jgi:ankyrin repeat protein
MRSPLHYAGIYGNLEITRMLLDAGASSREP